MGAARGGYSPCASKVCRKCGTHKDGDQFPKNRKLKDGLDSWCRACHTEQSRSWKEENREKTRRRSRERYEKNPEKGRLASQKYRERNREKVREDAKRRYWQNREKCLLRYKEWLAANPDQRAAIDAKRRAAKLAACPVWLTSDDFDRIKDIYKSCPNGFHVDHIVPLQGKNVCGLHVPENLRVVPAFINLSKSNNWDSSDRAEEQGNAYRIRMEPSGDCQRT